MRYFKIVGEKVNDGEPTEIFVTGQLKAAGPVEALEFFVEIFKSTNARKQVESVFAQGGYLVLKEMK